MQPEPRLAASMAGALDLSALKARATAPPPAPAPANGTAAPTGSNSPYIIDVTEASFQADVIDRSMQVPVVLDLWASWCEPCKQLSPILEKLAIEGNGAWILAKLDVDANPRIAQALRIQGIPAVKAVLQGQLVAEFSGAIPEAEARQFVAALVEAAGGAVPEGAASADAVASEPEDPRVLAAEDAMGRGDFEAAAAAYQAILDSEPAHPYAADALLQVRFMQRLEGTGPDTVAVADATPDDVAAQCAAADVLVAQGRVEDAFSRLVELVRRTTGADRDTAREHLVSLFAVVGDDPRVATARRNLTNALF